MPITARLSRRFYDKFGDEIVNELVELLNQVDLAFRSELHQASDANFTRLEAKLHQELAEFRAEMRADMAALRSEMRGEMAALRGEMKAELHAMKAELMKWMFLFWAGTALAGLLLK
jgi:predicted house-cleaning noncanonical NTP pyrophosphatase (MazG superfamily)